MKLNEKLKKHIQINNLTEQIFSEYLNISEAELQCLENGTGTLTMEVIQESCLIFGCSIKDFLSESHVIRQNTLLSNLENMQSSELQTIAYLEKIASNLDEFNNPLAKANRIVTR